MCFYINSSVSFEFFAITIVLQICKILLILFLFFFFFLANDKPFISEVPGAYCGQQDFKAPSKEDSVYFVADR